MSVNKSFLLKRGWTRTAINRILGAPDRTLTQRRFRKDRPECIYDMGRVFAAEDAGLVRYRKPPDPYLPRPDAPQDLRKAMDLARSARDRRRIFRNWAESQGIIDKGESRDLQRRRLEIAEGTFLKEKKDPDLS